MSEGVDYASIDGNKIDYTKVKADFVIVRGSYTYKGSCLPDSCLARDRDHWRLAGKTFGAYMILGWDAHGPGPEDQAAVFIRTYGARREGEFPPSLDLEADSASAVGRTFAECLAWVHRAYDALQKQYGMVMIYTSVRVWSEVFGNLPSRMGAQPLWLKVPYPYKVHEPPHPEAFPKAYLVPGPWKPESVEIVQYQGDAIGVPGFSATVDCNRRP